jgi:hypothetical protein
MKTKKAPPPKKVKAPAFIPNEAPAATLVPLQQPQAGRREVVRAQDFRKKFGL